MLASMERLKFTEKTLIRTDPDLKDRFKTAIMSLGRRSKAQFTDQAPNMENTNAALWNWFAGLEREEAENFLAEQFPRLEKCMRGYSYGRGSTEITAATPTKVVRGKGRRSQKGVG